MKFEPLFDIRNIKNLKDMLEQSSRLYGEKNAFWIKGENGEYTGIKYSQFKADVDALGTAFINMGLKNERIAVIGENRYEWCVTYLAAANGTGAIVPLDKELPLTEVENLLSRSDAKAIVHSGRHHADISKIASSLPNLKYLINLDLIEDQQNVLSFSQTISKGHRLINEGDKSFISAEIDENDMSILLYTSGTTDLAKGVMLSHKNICTDMMAVRSVISIDSSDSILSILPLHHTYECTAGFLLMIYSGCTISFIEGLKHIAKNLKETRPSLLLAVPLILENMYAKIWEQASKKRGVKTKLKVALAVSNFLLNVFKIDLRRKLFKQIHDNIGGRIRLVISGAAAINPIVSKGFRSMGINVLQGYGLTECSPIVTANRENAFRDDSIGQPLPGVEVKLADMNSEGIGEIIVKGDIVMLGYFQNQEATDMIIRDGWLYTGDLAHSDNSGFFYITGRKKNVIVTKNGKNIFPEEVESYLNKSPFIQESVVWGKYHEDQGETLVHAQIFPAIDVIKDRYKLTEITDAELYKVIASEIKVINRLMPLYKHIRHFTLRTEEFEKTTTKKIKRYKVF